jgi:elongation factor G
MALSICSASTFQEALKKAKAIILEPSMNIEIELPVKYTGDVISDLNSRRGKIKSLEEKKGLQIVETEAPLSEMFGYSTQLRSITQGRASFSMNFSHYIPVTEDVSNNLRGLNS